MAKTQQQYLVTNEWIKRFEGDLEDIKSDQHHFNPVIQNAIIGGIESILTDLRQEVEEYERINKIG